MTSINEIKKLNELTKSLMNHNPNQSRNEAAEKAKEMMKNPVMEDQPMNQTQPTSNSNDLTIEKLANAMKKNSEFITKTILDFQKELSSLKNQMEEIKKDMKQLKLGSVPRQQPAPPKIQTNDQPTKETTSHPKGGSTKNEDVAIEKIFYYGDK